MCGILAIISPSGQIKIPKVFGKLVTTVREMAHGQSRKQRHRGPDHTGVFESPDGAIFVHERLAVQYPATGDQPLTSNDGNIVLVANGEIYNHHEIFARIQKAEGHNGHFTPRSDCEAIIAAFKEYGHDLMAHINGMFAFVLYDKGTKTFMVARDPIGIIPLYQGEDDEGNIWFASEMKCLVGVCAKIIDFQPGTYLHGRANALKRTQYFQPEWITEVPTSKVDLSMLRQRLESAVRSHLQSDAEYGCMLSGGLDSSLIAAIATRILREQNPDVRLKTYSVGVEGAPDLKYASMVAKHIQSDHTEILFKVEEALDCIREIIYHTESFDVTIVRCSIPMLLMARQIKSKGLRMILSGEGADELFGGYLYFHQAPSEEEFHRECVARLLELHKFECLRANKSTMAYGLELRVPFLDTTFVNYAMSIRPGDKISHNKKSMRTADGEQATGRIEKHSLRAAFTDNYLPSTVLWRQKEQLSDGVGYSYIDRLREFTEAKISDDEFERVADIFPINTPKTKEALFYRYVFDEFFAGEHCTKTVAKWSPRLDWGCGQDPSGRSQAIHIAAYERDQ